MPDPFTDPALARSYLASLSAHQGRPGDTSNLNPQFAIGMANAIQQARAAGMPVGLSSGFREAGQTGSAYDAGGNSSHTYGLASDISGLDGPNGKITNAWAQIAQQNGLHNPYGVGNRAEFNHWQLPSLPLEQTPQLLGQLKAAKASGNMQSVWNAFSPPGGTQTASAFANPPPAPMGPAVSAINNAAPAPGQQPMDDHSQFIRNYASQIGLNPNVALGVAGAEGLHAWGPNNPNAGSYVDRTNGQPWSFGDFQLNTRNGMGVDAMRAGINPQDPTQWQAADRFALDRMKAGGLGPWKGDQFARSWGNQPITGGQPMMAQNQQQQQVPPAPTDGPGIGSGYPTPTSPTAVASAAPAAPADAPPQNVGDWIKKAITRPPPMKDAQGNPVQGKSPLENIANAIKPPQQQQAPAAPDPQQAAAAPDPQQQLGPVQDPTAQMMGPSQQLLTAAIAAGAKPLSWSARPFGYQAGQQMGNFNG